ncbi:uncharacterized protein LOC142345554 isoform X2 [Convolutriloba macropyga]|uniref:uncharacterized protein LOC142345554 isoform X2 n=1 Tax=Convolutriloba macropyga TaxID=536237 RepID=UPI003F523739
MLDNMLYCYTEEGKLGKFTDYSIYLGEVKLFSELLLAKIEKSCGVLIRGFSNEHLKTIATLPEYSKLPNFEIDWLYLGKEHIVAFEVGLSENPEKAKQSSVSNKLKQCLTKIIPQMQLIIHSFWSLYSQNDTTSIGDLLKNTLKVVVCLPNIKHDIFESQITSIKEEVTKTWHTNCPSELALLVERNWAQVSNHLSFLVCNSSSNDLVWLKINDQLNVVKCDKPIDELFDRKTDPSESVLCKFDDVEIDSDDSRWTLKHSFIDYVSACLACAALSMSAFISDQNMRIEKTALDVNERYQKSFKKWRNKNFGENSDDHPQFNFVLSPQQHRILLDQNITHLILTGQPGTAVTPRPGYLSPESNNYTTVFHRFLVENITFTDWLEPHDSDMEYALVWWESELRKLMKGNLMQIIMRKPITIRLQLTAAFPRLFCWPSPTSPAKLNTGSSENTIVSCEEVECVDDVTISALNLLYWCAVSYEYSDAGTTKKCIQLLRKRNVLSQEINRRYPQATLFDIVVEKQRSYYNWRRGEKLDILLCCSEVESSTLTNKFKDLNFFEYSLCKLDLFHKLFSDSVRCDWFFMEYLGFENGESEERRIEKYQQWGGDILFTLLRRGEDYETLRLCLDVLRRYNLLQYEISLTKDGLTLLHLFLRKLGSSVYETRRAERRR